MADARAPARRGRDPALLARQRRAQHDLHAGRSGSRRSATPARSGCTTRARRHHEAASVLRRRIVDEFAPVARSGLQGLRRLARRRRGRGDRLGHGVPVSRCCRAAGRGPTCSTTTSRSSSPPRPSRSGRSRPTSSASIAISGSRWLRDLLARALRPARRAGSASAWTTTSTSRGRWSAAATRSSSTRRDTRRGAPCRSGCSRWRSCCARRPGVRVVALRRRRRAAAHDLPVRAARGRRAPTARAGATREATRGRSACRSRTTRCSRRR